MAKFSGPSVIAGAQPVLPVDQGQGDFAELFSAEATPVEAPESPQAIAPGLPTPETATAVTEEPRAVGDIVEAEAAVAVACLVSGGGIVGRAEPSENLDRYSNVEAAVQQLLG